MVEGTIVIPLVILLVLSMILLVLHFYRCLAVQTDVHTELLAKPIEKVLLYDQETLTRRVASKGGGLVTRIFRKSITDRYYLINEVNLIRAGDFFDEEEGV